jgi:energy-coupling factor transporter ATP-binding protein EcfA2
MMFTLKRQFQAALLLPLGFLALRAVYAVLFGGASSGSTLLLNIESINLSGPFSHVTLFGPIYLEGLIANVSTALPFAVFIAISALLVIFLKPSQLFSAAKSMPKFQPILTAIAIGWIQLPALIQAAVRVNRAIKLRREKRIRALIPILETAIETSLGLAQRLILGAQSGNANQGLELRNVAIREAGLSEVNLTVKAGECLVVTGITGSGKSSLLMAATGFGSELGLSVTGEIYAPGHIGFVAQQARGQLFGPLVQDEIEPTETFGLDTKLSTPVHQLSEGEAIQVSLIRELQKQPALLILDEPFSSLDTQSAPELVKLLRSYLEEGGSLLIAEHRPELLEDLSTATYHLEDGRLQPGLLANTVVPLESDNAYLTSDEVLAFAAESIGYKGRVLLDGPQLRIRQSEIAAVTGPNGAGKTSLLNAIANSTSDIVLVPEQVSDFFVTTTLRAELERSDRIAKDAKGFTQANLESILGELPSLDTHPRDLSAGTQLALAIAMQLSHKPKVLLIDEPARGFDEKTKSQVIATLECVRETGCAIIFASHDSDLISKLSTTVYRIADKQLQRVSEVLA